MGKNIYVYIIFIYDDWFGSKINIKILKKNINVYLSLKKWININKIKM